MYICNIILYESDTNFHAQEHSCLHMIVTLAKELVAPMIRRYPPNPMGTKNAFSDIRVLSIHIYVLSLSYLAMGINLVRDKGPRD